MRSYNKIMSYATVSSVIFFLFALCVGVPLLGGLTDKKNRGASHDEPLKKLNLCVNLK